MIIVSAVTQLEEFRDDVVRFSEQKNRDDNPSYFTGMNLKFLYI